MDLPDAGTVHINPGHDWLREQALRKTPRITETEFGNLNYTAQVTSRLPASTFFVADHGFQNTMRRPDYEEWSRLQDAHLSGTELIAMEGFIGPDIENRVGVRLVIEASQANIAGMQSQLYFPKDDTWSADLTVLYTPSLPAPGMPDERLIAIDLENGVTRVLGSDYFGESKMGGLRMWNKLVYDQGGLGLHAGLKTFPASSTPDGAEHSMLIIGLSGTGKTTTTFSRQLSCLPVQDDFVALMPGGNIRTTENGCFAKTFGLNAEDEPTIYAGTTRSDAWLENVRVSADGMVDFSDDSHTANGRSTFPLAYIPHRSPSDVPPLRYLLILNRSDHIIPAVAKLNPAQVPGYFMLGETKGTSAGGAAEDGRSLRIPGTNPFFFSDDSMQGNRLMELFETLENDVGVYVLNTGRIGGVDNDARSKKVRISDSSAIIEGIVTQSIDWEVDPDFGYSVARAAGGIDNAELLRPRLLYERQGRAHEYADKVAMLKAERRQYLEAWPTLRREIVEVL